MAGEFTLHIRLGNAEMRTPEHIARELHAVADQLADDPQKDGTIIEVNGNSVGSFHMELPQSAECADCGRSFDVDDLAEPKRLQERLDPGGVVPAGECPECGALAYPA